MKEENWKQQSERLSKRSAKESPAYWLLYLLWWISRYTRTFIISFVIHRFNTWRTTRQDKRRKSILSADPVIQFSVIQWMCNCNLPTQIFWNGQMQSRAYEDKLVRYLPERRRSLMLLLFSNAFQSSHLLLCSLRNLKILRFTEIVLLLTNRRCVSSKSFTRHKTWWIVDKQSVRFWNSL